MKNLRLLSFPMLLLFIFSTQGCHKDVISEQDTQPATSDLVENFVSDSYFAQANKYYKPSGENKIQSRTRVAQVDAVKDFFISHTSVVLHLVNTIGYPVWDESITSENNGDELLILPFSKLDTNRMDAVMLIHKPAGLDSMYFKTIRRNELHNLPSVSALSPDANEKYTELSREFATTMVLYFEYAIFTEVDCELANTTFGNPLSEPILESRGERCYYVEYVQEIQYWNRYAGGVMIYQESTIRYSWELVCDQIMDPGGFTGGGGSNWGYDPGGSTGSGNNNNENNAGPTLADCRQSNPDVLKRIFELSSQKLVSACHKGRSINFDWNYIENELCKNDKYDVNSLNSDYNDRIINLRLTTKDHYDNMLQVLKSLGLDEDLIKEILCDENNNILNPIDVNEFEERIDGLCWNSLTITNISQGFYTKINNFSFAFHHPRSGKWVHVTYPSLCIQVNGRDENGSLLSDDEIKRRMANSIENARRRVLNSLNSLSTLPFSYLLSLEFKTELQISLNSQFSGFPTINTDANGCWGVENSNVDWSCN